MEIIEESNSRIDTRNDASSELDISKSGQVAIKVQGQQVKKKVTTTSKL